MDEQERGLALDAAFDAAALAEVQDQAELRISREQLRKAEAEKARLYGIIEDLSVALKGKKQPRC